MDYRNLIPFISHVYELINVHTHKGFVLILILAREVCSHDSSNSCLVTHD
jgi:hypothetical protein